MLKRAYNFAVRSSQFAVRSSQFAVRSSLILFFYSLIKLGIRGFNMDDIAILIPCYNEALTIKKVIQDWQKAIPEAKIYVYDNNSTDNTSEIAFNAGAIVRREPIQGKGNVIRRMFQEINAKSYIMIDGDDTYPADNGHKMINFVLNENIDMVIGDRTETYSAQNKRPFHNFGNNFVKSLINKIFNANINDIMTGYRALSYRFVKSFPVISQGFEIETEMTIHAVDKNMSLKNFPIQYRDRPAGSVSKLRTIPDGIKVLRTIFNLFCNYEPLKFFSIIAVFLAALSILFFVPVFNEYMKTGLVARFPTLIVCGFGMLAAIIAFFSGVILQSIKFQERREFEFRLQQINNWPSLKENLS